MSTRKFAVTLLALGCALGVAAQEPQETPTAALPRTVAMSAGVCASVADGNIVTFDWNPAFDNTSAVTGLHDFTLTFLRAGQDRIDLRMGHGLTLQARPHRTQGLSPADSPVTAFPNGFYQLRFRVHLGHVASGEYHLAAATAEPEVSPDYTGPLPQMTKHSDPLPVLPQRGRHPARAVILHLCPYRNACCSPNPEFSFEQNCRELDRRRPAERQGRTRRAALQAGVGSGRGT